MTEINQRLLFIDLQSKLNLSSHPGAGHLTRMATASQPVGNQFDHFDVRPTATEAELDNRTDASSTTGVGRLPR
ncbi:MAG: hypothetical protein GY896_03490 [Gammaproteobacteria bacterium]|nr:hypothetical protein [Gammaproteobacteria bacterium]